jgi:response regulator RpfG family c-di-GMP phosphodiesterase
MSKVLFVDDEPRVLDALRRMILTQGNGWNAAFSLSAADALDQVAAGGIDAIVSDLNMPGMNGIEFLKKIREDESRRWMPFIMLTGNTDTALKREALSQGATDFVQKPCDFLELTARLMNAIQLKRAQDQLAQMNQSLECKVTERTQELEVAQREVIFRLAKAAEARDGLTGSHIIRVGLAARLIGEQVGLSAERLRTLQLAAPLHDVGKIGLPDGILNKPGRLTEQERRVMQSHCEIGAEILGAELSEDFERFSGAGPGLVQSELLIMAARIALTHHERWDGTGYPLGLRGAQIPMEGRITAIADVYDALRSARPYKEPFSVEKSVELIQEASGTHFDPELVEAFMKAHPAIERIVDDFKDAEIEAEDAA